MIILALILLFGSGGAPEGVIAAVALKCLGGEIQGKLLPQNDAEAERCMKMGIEPNAVFRMEDLVRGDDAIFAATGVTDGELLKGVQFKGANGTQNPFCCHASKIRHSPLCRRST